MTTQAQDEKMGWFVTGRGGIRAERGQMAGASAGPFTGGPELSGRQQAFAARFLMDGAKGEEGIDSTEAAIESLLGSQEGRNFLMQRRYRLAAAYATALARFDGDVGREVHELTQFDLRLYTACGVTRSTGYMVRVRGTGELVEMVEGFERDVIGTPHVRVKDRDLLTPSKLPLVDVEALRDDEVLRIEVEAAADRIRQTGGHGKRGRLQAALAPKLVELAAAERSPRGRSVCCAAGIADAGYCESCGTAQPEMIAEGRVV